MLGFGTAPPAGRAGRRNAAGQGPGPAAPAARPRGGTAPGAGTGAGRRTERRTPPGEPPPPGPRAAAGQHAGGDALPLAIAASLAAASLRSLSSRTDLGIGCQTNPIWKSIRFRISGVLRRLLGAFLRVPPVCRPEGRRRRRRRRREPLAGAGRCRRRDRDSHLRLESAAALLHRVPAARPPKSSGSAMFSISKLIDVRVLQDLRLQNPQIFSRPAEPLAQTLGLLQLSQAACSARRPRPAAWDSPGCCGSGVPSGG